MLVRRQRLERSERQAGHAGREARLSQVYAALPLSFEANEGQIDPQVRFLARGAGYNLFLTSREAVLDFGTAAAAKEKAEARDHKTEAAGSQNARASRSAAVVRMRFLGATSTPRVSGLDELQGKSNYFVGNDPHRWRTGIPTYGKVHYQGIYPGIDLIYYGNQGRLEYDFVVSPGAKPGAIQLGFEAAVESRESRVEGEKPLLRLDSAGDLLVTTQGRTVRLHKPSAYQPFAIRNLKFQTRTPKHEFRTPNSELPTPNSELRTPVDARYVLESDNRVGVRVADYDASRPLVIDPVLTYSTYLGGGAADIANGIAIDAHGYAYVTGATQSTNFPTAPSSPFQGSTGGGQSQVFVTKLNPGGTAPVYSTYLGGNGSAQGNAIAVDSMGNVYVTGTTFSPTGTTSSPNFPTAPATGTKPFQSAYGGGTSDAFVAEVASSGNSLVYSSYLGGGGADFGQGIAVDAAGNAYVTGSTSSTDLTASSGAVQATNTGGSDAFIAKVNSGGAALGYLTYLGGSAADYGQAIAVDGGGNAYVTGYTLSTNFPVANPLPAANGLNSGANGDAFVAKINPAGSALAYSTYLGGNGLDRGFGIAIDGAGDAFVTGDTTSTNIPATSGGVNSGNGDAFVAELNLNPAGNQLQLVYFTYLGGSGADQATAIALDGAGSAYVTGPTQSADFPVHDALQPAIGCSGANCANAFVSKIAPGGALAYATYLGGNGADSAQSIAVDGSGNVYVAGGTASANFPVIPGALQPVYGGSGAQGDGFVAKIGPADSPALAASPASVSFPNQGTGVASAPQTVTLTNAGSTPLNITTITANSPFQVASGGTCTQPDTLASGANCTVNVTFTPTTTSAATGSLTITDNAAGSPQAVPLSGTGATPGPAVTFSPATSAGSPLTFPTLTVGQTSAPQFVTMTNSGSAALSVTAVAFAANYANSGSTCSTTASTAAPFTLQPGQSCTFGIVFAPGGTASTAGGSLLGTVSITDNTAAKTDVINLTGVANPVYTLTSTSASSTVLVGTASTTFTVGASAPSGFTTSINLSCSAGAGSTATPTCSFSPTSITAGQTSTLTVSGLNSSTTTIPNPDNFKVTGSTAASTSSTNQTAQLPLTILLSDFSVYATPPLDTITAGQSATYTVTVAPSNGFNQSVSFGCNSTMQAATCTFSPTSVTPNGSAPVSTTLTVKTTASTSSGGFPSRLAPPAGSRTPIGIAILALVLLAMLAARNRSARALFDKRFAWMTLAGALLFVALASSCNDYTGFNIIVPNSQNGTAPGTYTLTIVGTYTSSGSTSTTSGATTVPSCAGTLVSPNAVTHCTGVNLSVGK